MQFEAPIAIGQNPEHIMHFSDLYHHRRSPVVEWSTGEIREPVLPGSIPLVTRLQGEQNLLVAAPQWCVSEAPPQGEMVSEPGQGSHSVATGTIHPLEPTRLSAGGQWPIGRRLHSQGDRKRKNLTREAMASGRWTSSPRRKRPTRRLAPLNWEGKWLTPREADGTAGKGSGGPQAP